VLLSNRCAALVGLGVVGGEVRVRVRVRVRVSNPNPNPNPSPNPNQALADARGAVLADPSFLKGYLRLGNVRACLT